MATKKPAPKKAAKPAAKPAAKKTAPAKKAAAKPAPKKAAPAPAKKAAAKPVAKKTAPVKKAPEKPAAKQPAKVADKKTAPAATPAPAPKQPAAVKAPKPQPEPVKKPEPKAEVFKEVKVPKTTVKTSVPYTPDYKPLEQRQTSLKNNDPLIRYSDADLAEFRELITKKLEAAKKELNYLQGLITRTDEMGGDESENRYMTMEDGSMSMEREQLSQMASRQITYIDHLEKALIRIENKTYGICRVTGRLIDKARLRAVPHATLSLEAKLGLVKPSSEQ
ncbi:MAG TPA: TraR/DksA C4-type zinc finger protein [Chitinophagaceae bacterium]|jgi:RNA polymerase-binding transcription factor DksA|nr:TraR/DksA C4-type zinc finger protein [Chitinophagaceae bacterium]